MSLRSPKTVLAKAGRWSNQRAIKTPVCSVLVRCKCRRASRCTDTRLSNQQLNDSTGQERCTKFESGRPRDQRAGAIGECVSKCVCVCVGRNCQTAPRVSICACVRNRRPPKQKPGQIDFGRLLPTVNAATIFNLSRQSMRAREGGKPSRTDYVQVYYCYLPNTSVPHCRTVYT